MKLVVDASFAYRALMSMRSDGILEDNSELLAPDIIVGELLNARWKCARAGGATPDVSIILGLCGRLDIVQSLRYAVLAARLAERLDHPIYDCLYVAVAEHENLQLLTSDLRLTRKLRSHKLGSLLA